MSKIKLALEVVEDLRQLAGSLETLANALQAGEPQTGTNVNNSTEEKALTLEEVRSFLAQKAQAGKQAEVKALIVKYGASKLTEIEPKNYRALLAEAQVL